MSKRILITFGGKAYDAQTKEQSDYVGLHRIAHCGGNVDNWIAHKVYDDRWLIGTPFYQHNRWIFERKPQHGFGFCSWKPYIIQHALCNFAQTGDVVMYLDADTYPVADISCLFDMAERDGIVLFEEQGCVNRTWIKGTCFLAMNAYEKECLDAMHACGRFQLFKKPEGFGIVDHFLQAWAYYSLDPLCQFHECSQGLGMTDFDDPSFIRNSCEQSVLSILAYKYGVPLHRTPDQGGWPVAHDGTYKPDDKYPQLFQQVGARGDVSDLSGSRFRNIE